MTHSPEDVRAALPDAAAVRRALERRDLVYGLTVDQVMSVVGPVLEGRDAEIAKLRRELRDENDRILELIAQNRHLTGQPERACCCDHEGWYDSRCAFCNKKAEAEAVKNGSQEGHGS